MGRRQLRCANKLHGELLDDIVEIKCDSRWCGARKGVMVLHRFDRETGELTETLRLREPPRPNEEQNGNRRRQGTTVRPP